MRPKSPVLVEDGRGVGAQPVVRQRPAPCAELVAQPRHGPGPQGRELGRQAAAARGVLAATSSSSKNMWSNVSKMRITWDDF